jgi:hypothetical protein
MFVKMIDTRTGRIEVTKVAIELPKDLFTCVKEVTTELLGRGYNVVVGTDGLAYVESTSAHWNSIKEAEEARHYLSTTLIQTLTVQRNGKYYKLDLAMDLDDTCRITEPCELPANSESQRVLAHNWWLGR